MTYSISRGNEPIDIPYTDQQSEITLNPLDHHTFYYDQVVFDTSQNMENKQRFVVNKTFRNCKLVGVHLNRTILINSAFIDCDFTESQEINPMLALNPTHILDFDNQFIFFTKGHHIENIDCSKDFIAMHQIMLKSNSQKSQNLLPLERNMFQIRANYFKYSLDKNELLPQYFYDNVHMFACLYFPNLVFIQNTMEICENFMDFKMEHLKKFDQMCVNLLEELANKIKEINESN